MQGAYDVAVVGLGAVGSSAVAHLTALGCSVVGLDRFAPGHHLSGSADGHRTFRQAYFQDDTYVALAKRSEALWRALHDGAEQALFDQCGAILLAPSDHPVCGGVLHSAAQHTLAVDELRGPSLEARSPAFVPGRHDYGLFERRAGVLHALRCDARHRGLAVARGAEISALTAATSLNTSRGEATLQTDRGEIRARDVVLCCGPWVGADDLGGGLDLPITVVRQVQCDFTVDPDARERWSAQTPWNVAMPERRSSFYGSGLRPGSVATVGKHLGGVPCARPVDVEPSSAEVDELTAFARENLRGLSREPVATRVGYYACTPDAAPVVGRHPRQPRVFVAMGLSGHGYKFAAAIGEHIAECIAGHPRTVDLAAFAPDRFEGTPARGGAR
ncbi:MAG: N-methyl-L-tryptophan oxidase [Myxococcota bacterium]